MRVLLSAMMVLVLTACPSTPGTPGEQGPQGPIGPAGATGAQGETGAPGPSGPAGADGAPGINGTNGVAGPQGPEGQQGIQGPAGVVTVLDGGVVVGPPGSSVVVTPISAGGQPCFYGGVRITQVSDGGITSLCNGEPGFVQRTTVLPTMSPQCATGGLLLSLPDGGANAVCNGAAGAQGPQGVAGPMGPAGSIGMTGAQGPIGMTGPAGVQGPAGPTGATGSSGPMGTVGPMGPAGPAGATGSAGVTGAEGPAGSPGPMGSVGPTGPTGAQGPQGPAGAVLFLDGGVVVVSSPASLRPLVVGVTAFTSAGNIGSRLIANSKCDAEFSGSHLCTTTEYRYARSLLAIPAPGSWLDYSESSTSVEPESYGPCNSFTVNVAGNYSSLVALPSGLTFSGQSAAPNCATVMPLTCCKNPLKTHVAGVTSFVSNGNIGSRQIANAKCAQEFSGSHLCTTTEYRYARSMVTIPSPGSWLDYSESSTAVEPESYGPCNSFTVSASGNYSSLVALPSGLTFSGQSAVPNCSTVMPLTCCD